MVERVFPRSDSPPPAATRAFSPAVPFSPASSSEAPPLVGRATSEQPLTEAPKNDPHQMARYGTDIAYAENIPSLNGILSQLRKGDISNNAEKLVLVAECYIRIAEIDEDALSPEEASEPLNNLKQALQVLKTYRYEVQDKCRLLYRMMSLYNRIKNGPLSEEKQHCKILYYTARMELITDLISANDFSRAGEYLSELTNLTPELQIALIPILVKMIYGTQSIVEKNQWLGFTEQTARDALVSIRATSDTPRSIALLKSFIAELKKIEIPADEYSQNVTDLIALYRKNAERALNILEPKPKLTPLAITLIVLGALALISFGAYRTYRHWSKA